jgi:hypothetical protein
MHANHKVYLIFMLFPTSEFKKDKIIHLLVLFFYLINKYDTGCMSFPVQYQSLSDSQLVKSSTLIYEIKLLRSLVGFDNFMQDLNFKRNYRKKEPNFAAENIFL